MVITPISYDHVIECVLNLHGAFCTGNLENGAF